MKNDHAQDDLPFLRREILRHCASMGATGHKPANLAHALRSHGFPGLTDETLREQTAYLLEGGLLARKPSALDPGTERYALTEAGRAALA